MNRGFAFGFAGLISLVAFYKLRIVPTVKIADCLSGFDVEHPVWRIFPGYLKSLCQQTVGLFYTVFRGYVHDIHVDRRHTGIVACFLHHLKCLAPILFCLFIIATVAVDMSQHVRGHIHFLVQLLFTQFCREFTGQFVGFEYPLLVHEEYNNVAALGIVGVGIVLFLKITEQIPDSREKPCGVAIVESMVHGVT